MLNKSILMGLVFLFVFSPLSLAYEREKIYKCEKEDIKVELTLSITETSCRVIINESNGGETIPAKKVDSCEAILGKKIVKYIDQEYICVLSGTGETQ